MFNELAASIVTSEFETESLIKFEIGELTRTLYGPALVKNAWSPLEGEPPVPPTHGVPAVNPGGIKAWHVASTPPGVQFVIIVMNVPGVTELVTEQKLVTTVAPLV